YHGARVYDYAGVAQVLDRHADLEVEGLAHPGVDDADRPGPPLAGVWVLRPATEEAGDLVERALGGRQADALRRLRGQALEALERQRQMGAPLRAGDG